MVPARAVLLACRARWLRPARRVRVDTRGSKVFKSARANKAFKRFCKFVANKGTRDLEIAAHLHYLRHTEDWEEARIRKAVEDKRDEFTKEMVDKTWGDMRKEGVV